MAKASGRRLTPQQARFVDEYLIDLNATQAAIRASYSPRTAAQIASQLMDNPLVANAVAAAQARRSARTGITADRVLRELAAVAFARLPDVAEWGDDAGMRLLPSAGLADEDARAIQSVTEVEKFVKSLGEGEQLMSRERTIKLHDKVKALTKIGDHLGLWNKEPEPAGDGLKIIIEGE